MRITDVELIRFTYTSHMVRDAEGHTHPGEPHEATQAITHIATDEGIDGYAMGGVPAAIPLARDVLIGEDPLYRERIWQLLHQFQRMNAVTASDRAIATIDLALWDLAGKAAGVPVYKLLGAFRDSVPAYASTMCGDDIPGGLDSPAAYADFAEQCIAQGYRAFKLHTWSPPYGPDPRRDVAACVAVRERVGPEIDLMLDSYHHYSRMQALYIGRALEELDFHWFEEPMDERSMSSYVWLADQLDIPIVGPETMTGMFYTRAEWIIAGAADISRYDVNLAGLTPMVKAVHLCEAFNVALEVHGGGHGNLHMLGAMGVPGEYYERGLLHPLYDFEAAQPWLASRIDDIDAEGNVRLPQAPGLGLDLNWEFIDRNRI